MSDVFSVEYETACGRRLRIRFTPRDYDRGYWRIVEERVGFGWDRVSREPVGDVTPGSD